MYFKAIAGVFFVLAIPSAIGTEYSRLPWEAGRLTTRAQRPFGEVIVEYATALKSDGLAEFTALTIRTEQHVLSIPRDVLRSFRGVLPETLRLGEEPETTASKACIAVEFRFLARQPAATVDLQNFPSGRIYLSSDGTVEKMILNDEGGAKVTRLRLLAKPVKRQR